MSGANIGPLHFDHSLVTVLVIAKYSLRGYNPSTLVRLEGGFNGPNNSSNRNLCSNPAWNRNCQRDCLPSRKGRLVESQESARLHEGTCCTGPSQGYCNKTEQ